MVDDIAAEVGMRGRVRMICQGPGRERCELEQPEVNHPHGGT